MARQHRSGHQSLAFATGSLALAVAAAALHFRGIWSDLLATLSALAVAVCGTYLVQWWAERKEPKGTDPLVQQLHAWRRDLRRAILDHRVRTGSQLDQMVGQGRVEDLRAMSFELAEGQDGTPRIRFKGIPVQFSDVVGEWVRARGRLVLTAEPGYGKTVAALTALAHFNGVEDADGRAIAEIFPLAEWYRWHLDHPSAPLSEWLATELAINYPVPQPTARDLVDHDLIVPLLDGLDEVPSDRRAACMDAIEGYSGRAAPFRPFLLTCRAQEYRDLAPRWVQADQQAGFVGLDAPEIARIIGARTVGRQGWPLIRQQVDSGNQMLVHLFRSPLRLSIVLQAYAQRDPGELLDLGGAAAEDRIWDLLLEADGAASASRAYSALSFLAARMRLLATQHFHLHEIYRYVPGRSIVFRRFRYAMGWAAGIAGGLIIGAGVAFDNGLGRGQVGMGLENGGIDAVLFGFVAGIGARYGTREAMTVRLPTRLALRRARIWAAVGVAWGLLIAVTRGEEIAPQRMLTGAAANAVARGAMTVVVLALVLGLAGFVFASNVNRSARPPAALSARAPRAVVAAATYRWLLMGAGGVVIGIFVGQTQPGLAQAILTTAFTGLLCALLGGLGTWLYHYWLRWLLARRCELPRQLPSFLDWCAEPKRSWLRIADGYEFRHRELLDHLAAKWTADQEGRSRQEEPQSV